MRLAIHALASPATPLPILKHGLGIKGVRSWGVVLPEFQELGDEGILHLFLLLVL